MPTIKRQPVNRIGYGFDSHEFRAGIPLKIGGVTLAHDRGLGGHSDGDVLLHAVTDALLGAIAAPDIGALFPPSDPKWKGADSVIFLREALDRVRQAGYRVANMDSSLVLACPKIGPHAASIRRGLAELLDLESDCVGLKAKTPEGLNLENSAVAHVVVLLERIAPPGRIPTSPKSAEKWGTRGAKLTRKKAEKR
ncbi:MAG TPA: 2-C-methyl-D-erythritol 2,4-cyclodiphosphate synthase [Candidatus Sulfotelmatobacter sp.]|nr:2-C-methyl-D-erythritol 2,4-cyclodiphosphate synthase [Candidatus Sulfotelmatobacter sp.]